MLLKFNLLVPLGTRVTLTFSKRIFEGKFFAISFSLHSVMNPADLEDNFVKIFIEFVVKADTYEKQYFGLAPPNNLPAILFKCCFLDSCQSVPNYLPGFGVIPRLCCEFNCPLVELRDVDLRILTTYAVTLKDLSPKERFYPVKFLRNPSVKLFACFNHFTDEYNKQSLTFENWFENRNLENYFLTLPSLFQDIPNLLRFQGDWSDHLYPPVKVEMSSTPNPSQTSPSPSPSLSISSTACSTPAV